MCPFRPDGLRHGPPPNKPRGAGGAAGPPPTGRSDWNQPRLEPAIRAIDATLGQPFLLRNSMGKVDFRDAVAAGSAVLVREGGRAPNISGREMRYIPSNRAEFCGSLALPW
jgi:hypothetical protein